MSVISSIETRLFHIPLAEVLVDAKHGDHHFFELITATVKLEDGTEGTGYTYTGGKGGHAIKAMIEHDLTPFLIGQDGTDVEALYDAMQWHVHYVARGGIASFAISAVDIALWDLRGKRSGQALWKMAGGAARACKAYCGGIDLGFDLPKLLSSVQGYLDRGFNGVKIKIGQPTLEEDIERMGGGNRLLDGHRIVSIHHEGDVRSDQLANPMICYGLKNRSSPMTTQDMHGFPRQAGRRLRWARTCIQFTSLNTHSRSPSCVSSSLTVRTVVGLPGSCKWPNFRNAMTFRSVAMACKNYTLVLWRRGQMRAG